MTAREEIAPLPLAERTAFLANKMGGLLLRAAEVRLDELGLSTRTYFVLSAIDGPDPPSQQRLARLLGIDPTPVVGLIDELESGGLVTRQRNLSDRRRYDLRLTSAGQAVLSKANHAIDELEQEFFAPLTANQLAQFHRALHLLIKDRWPPKGH